MAPRLSVRRLVAAVPAIAATALVLSACHPPNEQPSEDDSYTLPTYVEPEGSDHGSDAQGEPTATPSPEAGAEGENGEGAAGAEGEGAPAEGENGEMGQEGGDQMVTTVTTTVMENAAG